MRGRLILAGVVAAAGIAATCFAPTGVSAVKNIYVQESQEQAKYDAAQAKLHKAESDVTAAVNTYNSSRDFDIYYGDVDRLLEVFAGLPGIQVRRTTIVDHLDNFGEVVTYQSGSQHAAVKVELVVSDLKSAITIIDTMDLPVVSIQYSYPNLLTVVFMTGGTV